MPRKKTNEEFMEEVYGLVKDEYTFLEEYVNNATKILVRHNKCGYEYSVTPGNFFFGRRCPRCQKSLKRDTDYFKKEISDLSNGKFILNSEYKTLADHVSVKHTGCNKTFSTTAAYLINNLSCPYCTKENRRKEKEKELIRFLSTNNPKLILLSSYLNNHSKIKILDQDCGYIWDTTACSLLSGSGCPRCHGNVSITNDMFLAKISDKDKKEYTFLTPYIKSSLKISVKHDECGHIWDCSPTKFISGKRCPKCFKWDKKTNSQFKKEVFDLTENEYIFLDSYKNAQEKLSVRHTTCGNTYKVSPHKFLSGRRCPYCFTKQNSHGSNKIEKFLQKHKIDYIREYSFDDLRGKSNQKLRFDFCIHKHDGKLFLIEFDGEQHFQPVEHFGGEKALISLQERDNKKDIYCSNHNISLMRIPYTKESDIDTLLTNRLKKESVL